MPTMKFTIEEEKENKINFLDTTISKEKDNQQQQIVLFQMTLVIAMNTN